MGSSRSAKVLRNLLCLLFFLSIFGGFSFTNAQETAPSKEPFDTVAPTFTAIEEEDIYLIGEVEEVLEEGVNQILDTSYPYQILKVKIYTVTGSEIIEITNEIQPGGDESQRVVKGDR